jgi:hypothetical protein
LEDKTSIIKSIGLPETFAVVLLTFNFILFLAPYFSGADFGLFKIPQFTDSARKKLKIIGPFVFLLSVMLFVPLLPVHPLPPQVNANRIDVSDKVQQHIANAQTFFNMAEYKKGIEECEAALHLEPGNEKATEIKNSIERTIKTLKIE